MRELLYAAGLVVAIYVVTAGVIVLASELTLVLLLP